MSVFFTKVKMLYIIKKNEAEGMMNLKCQYCNCLESKVIDSRPTEDGKCIRRRRECTQCQKRFTTYEKVEAVQILVIKRDETREPFDVEKMKKGIVRACHKRPVTAAQIDHIVNEVEQFVFNSPKKEIKSYDIGEKIMQMLKQIDAVAYIRFASVYNRYEDVETFMNEINKMIKEKQN